MIKRASEKIVQAALRTHRLVKFEHLVFPGLHQSTRFYELSPQTVRGVDILMKVNMGSILLVKTMAATLNPDKVDFLLKLSKRTHFRVAEAQRTFAQQFAKDSLETVGQFLEIAEVFFRCLTLFMALLLNNYQTKNLTKRVKDTKVLYVENREISREVPRMVQQLASKNFTSKDQFNIEENKRFCVGFFTNFGTPEFKE